MASEIKSLRDFKLEFEYQESVEDHAKLMKRIQRVRRLKRLLKMKKET